MKPGDTVWLHTLAGPPLADADGHRIAFRVTAVQTLSRSGTWYLLHTEHPVAEEIFGGWHPARPLARIHPAEQTEGRTL
ncbi:hypothetical protein [Streptomyces violascens]|uniref:Uncharacterized protein n=1 Tax=Streptomyces violascens TaxID=67381 RepID=A0ABQ3QVA6_9ACTN|nr:hypothetical protein [Streptomyces violascens]GGU26490.1 hypothetical protein GCM10010289_54760 [Streptomyces violascens]GHI41213.1 hypothetical protein Sviol_56210 [Streptomyces violascens]